MKLTVSSNTVQALRTLLNEVQSNIELGDCLTDIKNGIKVTKLNVQGNFLEKISNRCLVTKEIQVAAKKRKGPNHTKRCRNYEKEILRTRIGLKESEMRVAKKKWWLSSYKVMSRLNLSSLRKYRQVIKVQTNEV